MNCVITGVTGSGGEYILFSSCWGIEVDAVGPVPCCWGTEVDAVGSVPCWGTEVDAVGSVPCWGTKVDAVGPVLCDGTGMAGISEVDGAGSGSSVRLCIGPESCVMGVEVDGVGSRTCGADSTDGSWFEVDGAGS